MSNEIKNIPGGNSAVSFNIYAETSGNEGVAIKGADGSIKAGDVFDLSTLDGQKAYLQKLQNLGISSKDLPSFVSNMETTGFVAGLQQGELSQLRSLAASISALSGGTGTGGNMAGVQAQWADFVAQKGVGNAMDVNSLVEFVLRESYLETNKDLEFYAQKVRFYNDLKKNIRDELTKAREFLSHQAGLKPEDAVDFNAYTNSTGGKGPLTFSDTPQLDKNGNPVPADPTGASDVASNKEGLDNYIKNLEEKLNSVGDDAQLANVDLQNILQKQQQTLQMMSNISKMLHDTALAIIRKIGG